MPGTCPATACSPPSTARPVAVRSVAFSPDGRLLATSSDTQSVRLWNVADRRLIATLDGPASVVYAVALSPDGRLLAAANDRRSVSRWEVPT